MNLSQCKLCYCFIKLVNIGSLTIVDTFDKTFWLKSINQRRQMKYKGRDLRNFVCVN